MSRTQQIIATVEIPVGNGRTILQNCQEAQILLDKSGVRVKLELPLGDEEKDEIETGPA